jgi:CPA2 family monovalent cation:H+ antiporter-2
MIAIPILARFAAGVGQRLEESRNTPAMPEPVAAPDTVILAGFGRVGQLVGEMLERHGIPYLAVDSNATLVAQQHAAGKPVYFGDSSSPEFLKVCGIDTAKAFVVTINVPAAIEAAVRAARGMRSDLTVVARARDARHATTLYRLGVNDAVPENIEASLQLSEAVLVDIGIAMGPVIASIHERRDEFRRILKAASDASGNEGAKEFRGRRGSKRPDKAVQNPPEAAA